jgi:hypothetical protein
VLKGVALITLFAGGAASLLYVARIVRSGKSEVTPDQPRMTTLAELSSIWTRDEDMEIIDLSELSKNWRNESPVPEAHPERPEPMYRHPEIKQFHKEMVEGKPFMIQNIRACIEELLELLDDEGDCPSVVKRNRKEAETGLASNVFDILAIIPLYRHSLNVAREIATLCTQRVVVPKAVIAALAHDLGKLPSYQESLYATGDHPYIASIVLGNVATFQGLAYADEVIEAVRQHHRPEPGLDLARKLKVADQASRSMEIASMLGPSKDEPAGKAVNEKKDLPEEVSDNDKTAKPSSEADAAQKSAGTRIHEEEAAAGAAVLGQEEDTDPDIFGSGDGRKEKVSNRSVPVDWFDPAAALAYLKQHINRIKGGRLVVFSMPDGYVYVQVSFFWQMAKRLSKINPELFAADADIQARRNIMYSMVERLDKESGAIAREFLGEGFYMAKFILNPDSENPQETSCIPFRVESFGVPVSVLEAKKISRVREIVKVTPSI